MSFFAEWEGHNLKTAKKQKNEVAISLLTTTNEKKTQENHTGFINGNSITNVTKL